MADNLEHWRRFETIEAAYDDLAAKLAAMTAARDDLLCQQNRSQACIERLNALLMASEAARRRLAIIAYQYVDPMVISINAAETLTAE